MIRANITRYSNFLSIHKDQYKSTKKVILLDYKLIILNKITFYFFKIFFIFNLILSLSYPNCCILSSAVPLGITSSIPIILS